MRRLIFTLLYDSGHFMLSLREGGSEHEGG